MSGTLILNRAAQLAIETEATCGTAETLVAADCLFRVKDASFSINVDSVPQDLLQSDLSELPDLIGNRPCEVSFSTLIAGSGTAGVAAGWSEILTHAGILETAGATVVYTPETPTTTNTATIGLWRGATSGSSGRLMIAKGCRPSSLSFAFNPGEGIMLTTTWSGAYSSHADAVEYAGVTYDSTTPVKANNLGLTIGSWTPYFKSLNININNTLAQVDNPGAASEPSGISHYEITARRIDGDIQFLEVLVSDKDHVADLFAETTAALAMTAGSAAGNKITFAMPALQFTGNSESNSEELLSKTNNFKAARSSGDDELTITTF